MDIFRGFAVAVAINGKKVELPCEDAEKARDILTRFLLEDEKAVFAEQDGNTKAKVYMAMSCLHQGVVAAIQSGVSTAFSPETKNNPLYAGGKPTIAFALSLNENKDVRIDVSAHLGKRTGPFRLMSQKTDDLTDVYICDDNAYFDCFARITMPAAAMDDFIKADWENYDHAKVYQTSVTSTVPDHCEKAVELIPERFRYRCEVEAGFHLHAESATKINEDIVPLGKNRNPKP